MLVDTSMIGQLGVGFYRLHASVHGSFWKQFHFLRLGVVVRSLHSALVLDCHFFSALVLLGKYKKIGSSWRCLSPRISHIFQHGFHALRAHGNLDIMSTRPTYLAVSHNGWFWDAERVIFRTPSSWTSSPRAL